MFFKIDVQKISCFKFGKKYLIGETQCLKTVNYLPKSTSTDINLKWNMYLRFFMFTQHNRNTENFIKDKNY